MQDSLCTATASRQIRQTHVSVVSLLEAAEATFLFAVAMDDRL